MTLKALGYTASTAIGILLLALMTGCAKSAISCDDLLAPEVLDQQKKVEVALVMAPTLSFTNFPAVLESTTDSIQDLLGDSSSRLSIVLADGSPRNVVTQQDIDGGQLPDEITKSQRSAIRKADHTYSCYIEPRDMKITEGRKGVAESDYLSALRVAADSFVSEQKQSKRHIVVVGNGLQTIGEVYNMAEKGIPPLSEVNALVGLMKSNGSLPDLRGATVDFVGLGLVNDGSEPLNQQSIDSLTAFWTAVVEASNGHVGVIQRTVGGDNPPSPKSIKVSPVASQEAPCTDVTVSESEGAKFAPGSATFLDATAAQQTAAGIVKQLNENKSCKGEVVVTGYVASATDKANYVFGNEADAQLSLARAQAFASLLQQAGATATFRPVGGGKGPEVDWDASGAFIEELGAKNRIVVVTQYK